MGDAQNPSGQVAVCPDCGRVTPTLSRDEYTLERAVLVVERGLCVCPGDTAPTGNPRGEQPDTY